MTLNKGVEKMDIEGITAVECAAEMKERGEEITDDGQLMARGGRCILALSEKLAEAVSNGKRVKLTNLGSGQSVMIGEDELPGPMLSGIDVAEDTRRDVEPHRKARRDTISNMRVSGNGVSLADRKKLVALRNAGCGVFYALDRERCRLGSNKDLLWRGQDRIEEICDGLWREILRMPASMGGEIRRFLDSGESDSDGISELALKLAVAIDDYGKKLKT